MDEGARGEPDAAWRADWDAHARRRRERWLAATPQQRLDWLEEALALVAGTGTVPGSRGDGDGRHHATGEGPDGGEGPDTGE